jgi:hypothetical protein
MKRSPLAFGTLVLILGLMIYQFGTLVTLHQLTLMNYVLKVLPDIQLVELISVLLQIFGIVLVVVGFISLVSGIFAIQLENEMRRLGREISIRIEEGLSNMIARQRLSMGLQNPQAARVCKFCGSPLEGDNVFCPKCGKSQK